MTHSNIVFDDGMTFSLRGGLVKVGTLFCCGVSSALETVLRPPVHRPEALPVSVHAGPNRMCFNVN